MARDVHRKGGTEPEVRPWLPVISQHEGSLHHSFRASSRSNMDSDMTISASSDSLELVEKIVS